MKYFKELDGIRAIAALMIMFCHFFQILNNKTAGFLFINKLANLGGTGVSLFFVLSGFLITRLLLKSKFDKKYFLNFYVRRALRIFPLYYLFLTIYYFIYPYFFNVKITSFKYQIF
jgi:peptidoglycan/LPS O-acetylase OafA/YrhL